MGSIEIVERYESHLLIRSGNGFAIIEQRSGRLYPICRGPRRAHPNDDTGLEAAAAESGWQREAAARTAFAELRELAETLANRLR